MQGQTQDRLICEHTTDQRRQTKNVPMVAVAGGREGPMSVFAWVCVGVSQEEEEEEEEEEERRAFSFLRFLSLVSFLCFCFFSLPSCVPDRDPHHAAQGAGRHNPKSTVWRKPQPTFLRLCFFAFLSFFLLSLAFPSPYRSSKPIAAASFPSAFAPN